MTTTTATATATAATTSTPAAWSTKNKVGLGLAIFFGVANIPSFLFSAPDGQTGPPMGIMIVSSILGAVATVAGVVAWRKGSRPAARLTAASLIVVTLTSLPAFFVDVPAGIKVVTAVGIVLTVVIVVLMFSPQRRRA